MRHLLNSDLRRLTTGWYWPLVLLALPNCALQTGGLGTPPILQSGPLPHADALMCDIEKFQGRHCASAEEIATGIRLMEAATALVTGHSGIGLDDSPAALSRCSGGPEAVKFQGAFPDGFVVCLNCGAVFPALHADHTAACVAECQDLIANGEPPKPADPLVFCTANARPSTNFPTSSCFANACSDGGTLRSDFADPRKNLEKVVWRDLIGAAAGGVGGNDVTRTAVATGMFDAGAGSDQWIKKGDGYVEFEASETNKSHALGLSTVPGACAFPCADADPSLTDIGFAISLNIDGRFYIVEGGSLVMGPDVNGSFGTYAAGQRFRVKVKDNQDGTAVVTYAFVNVSPCTPGTDCPDTVFRTVSGAQFYPFRIDTSFREQ